MFSTGGTSLVPSELRRGRSVTYEFVPLRHAPFHEWNQALHGQFSEKYFNVHHVYVCQSTTQEGFRAATSRVEVDIARSAVSERRVYEDRGVQVVEERASRQ